jgi:integrase
LRRLVPHRHDVRRVHEDVHARRFFGPPKGGAGRVIDLPGFLADLLTEHIGNIGGRQLLFANRRSAAIRHTDFLARWRRACDGSLMGAAASGAAPDALAPICLGLRFHDLRHSHKNMLVELDVPEVLQDDRLAHRPPGMGIIYAHPTPAMREQMVYGLERIWADRRKAQVSLQIMAKNLLCMTKGPGRGPTIWVN